jgi:hypothetical protein
MPCLVLLVLLVATDKIHLKEQMLVAGTRQSRQADKAIWFGCLVYCPLICSQYSFSNLFFLHIYGDSTLIQHLEECILMSFINKVIEGSSEKIDRKA